MEGHLQETLAISKPGATRSREWMRQLITLLEAAVAPQEALATCAQVAP
jgi:hypothetical protein